MLSNWLKHGELAELNELGLKFEGIDPLGSGIFWPMEFAEMKLQAELLAGQARPMLQASGPESHPRTVAGLILGAIAVEVALKACIVRRLEITTPSELNALIRGKGKGHDIQLLISLLTDGERHAMQVHWEKYVPAESRHLVRYDGPGWPFVLRTRTIEEELEMLGKVFESWRYNYEHNPLIGNPDFMLTAISAALAALDCPTL